MNTTQTKALTVQTFPALALTSTTNPAPPPGTWLRMGFPAVLLARQAWRQMATTATALLILPAALAAQSDEVFPVVKINGDSYTNVTVVKATPVQVLLHYDGGAYNFKREDLPPVLAAKYPYDPAQARDWLREEALKRQAVCDQQRAEIYAGLVKRESRAKASLKAAQHELAQLQKELTIRANQAKGTRRSSPEHIEVNHLRDRKISLIQQIEQLEREVVSSRQLQSQYR